MGIRPKFVRGMRMTDGPTMDVVEMVLGGKINKSIVAQINRQGGGRGLSGKDGGLIQAAKMQIVFPGRATKPPEIIDPGMVGQVTRINPAIIHTLTAKASFPSSPRWAWARPAKPTTSMPTWWPPRGHGLNAAA
jgi:acetylglutamate kinase